MFKVNVILSNDILLKCVFPSHVSDLLSVLSWADSEGNTYTATTSYGKPTLCMSLSKIQRYPENFILSAFGTLIEIHNLYKLHSSVG